MSRSLEWLDDYDKTVQFRDKVIFDAVEDRLEDLGYIDDVDFEDDDDGLTIQIYSDDLSDNIEAILDDMGIDADVY